MTDQKRRKTDTGVFFDGFRDISKIVIMILLGIISYFLKGVNEKFKSMEQSVQEIQIVIAKVEVRDLANDATRKRLELEIKENQEEIRKLLQRRDRGAKHGS